jgi:hypothetical protein
MTDETGDQSAGEAVPPAVAREILTAYTSLTVNVLVGQALGRRAADEPQIDAPMKPTPQARPG